MSLVAAPTVVYGLKRVAQEGLDGTAALALLAGVVVAAAFGTSSAAGTPPGVPAAIDHQTSHGKVMA